MAFLVSCAPQHFRDARRNQTRHQRNFTFVDVVAPFGAAKLGEDRPVIFGVEKRVVRVSGSRQQDRGRNNFD